MGQIYQKISIKNVQEKYVHLSNFISYQAKKRYSGKLLTTIIKQIQKYYGREMKDRYQFQKLSQNVFKITEYNHLNI
jgi:hypothetical protein